MSFDTPVVLFLYNRPETTRRVFDAIRAVRPSKLLVVADGPRRKPGEAELCAETRAIIRDVDWDCELHTSFPETNLGVPLRFGSAFEWIFELVDEAIILEHDCVPLPQFFPYCAALLQYYRDEPRVMWIGGTNPLSESFGSASYFFARTNWVWGWATWKRAWRGFDIGVRGYPAYRRSGRISQISPYQPLQRGYMALFERAYAGEWINWDAQASFHIWNNDGLCIIPNGNLITNIGFGEKAENTKSPDDPLANLPFRPVAWPLTHPADLSVQHDFDIHAFDAHLTWMNDYANRSRYRKLPFNRAARGIYRLLRAS